MSCIFCKTPEEHSNSKNMEYDGCFRCSSCRKEYAICKSCIVMHIRNTIEKKENSTFTKEFVLCPVCERDFRINELIKY